MEYRRTFCAECSKYTTHYKMLDGVKFECIHCKKDSIDKWTESVMRLKVYCEGLTDLQLLDIGQAVKGVIDARLLKFDCNFEEFMKHAMNGGNECSG